jgi:two-component system CheB/CheR fusion protein
MFVTDVAGRVVLANERAIALLGVDPGQSIERAAARIVPPEAGRRFLEGLQTVVARGIAHTGELSLGPPTRERVSVLLSASALRCRTGGVMGVVATLREVREERAQRDTLLHRAYTLERMLEERTRDLVRARQAKDEFLGVLSHELRTPLTPILTWAQILEHERDPARVRQAAEVIERNVRLQISLVEDLLDLTRITQGTLALERGLHDLRSIVGTAVAGIAAPAGSRAIQVEWRPPSGPVPVEADAGRLGQAFASILSNGIKFSRDGGRVRVTLEEEPGTAVVRVSDDGAGIHPEFLPFVFEMFRQQEEGARREYGGLGVGLALAKRLVDLHGGGIEVTSGGVGQGTEVRVRLPLAAEREPGSPGPGGLGAEDRLDGLRFLLVDDSADTGDATRLLLEALGAEVALTRNGIDALVALGSRSVDAVLCDLRMPGLDGFEFLQRLRADPVRAHLPVVAVSGFARAVDVQRTREAGFDGHVSKPFECPALLAALRRAIDGRRRHPAA